MSSPLSESERIARLRLFRSQNIGPVTWRQLIARYGDAQKSLAALPDLAKRGGRHKPIKIMSADEAHKEINAIRNLGGELIVEGDEHFPPALAILSDAPPVLLTLSHTHLLTRHMFAIVGARNASAVGKRIASDIAAALGEHDFVIVSGMARGIDTAAHQGALAHGTAAVLAGGIDVVYPPENQSLYERICESGLIVSEMPLATKPQARHFPRRNRIISGLSLGALVVEAAPRSGSLITARFANEQGREVFAVPGSPLDPRAQGTNALIREGATLAQHAGDIIEVLADVMRNPLKEPGRELEFDLSPVDDKGIELSAARTKVRENIGYTPVEIDELIRQTALSVNIVMTVILELEIAGSLIRLPGNRVSLSSENGGT